MAGKRGLSWDAEELRELYCDRQLSCVDIADMKGCTEATVRYVMQTRGIRRRSKSGAALLAYRKHGCQAKVKPLFDRAEDLAYILGVVLGDGWLHHHRSNYRIGLNVTSELFAKSFRAALARIDVSSYVFVVKLSTKNPRHRDQHRIEASSRELFDWLIRLNATAAIGWLEDSPSLCASLLRGLYESEGALQCRAKHAYRITLYSSDWAMVQLMVHCLSVLDFRCSIGAPPRRSGRKQEYQVRLLGGTAAVRKFLSVTQPCIKVIP